MYLLSSLFVKCLKFDIRQDSQYHLNVVRRGRVVVARSTETGYIGTTYTISKSSIPNSLIGSSIVSRTQGHWQ